MAKEKLPQKEKIENHLKKYKSITTIQAFLKYRITRLSAHIHSLRNNEMNIRSKRMEDKKAGTWWFKYYI